MDLEEAAVDSANRPTSRRLRHDQEADEDKQPEKTQQCEHCGERCGQPSSFDPAAYRGEYDTDQDRNEQWEHYLADSPQKSSNGHYDDECPDQVPALAPPARQAGTRRVTGTHGK